MNKKSQQQRKSAAGPQAASPANSDQRQQQSHELLGRLADTKTERKSTSDENNQQATMTKADQQQGLPSAAGGRPGEQHKKRPRQASAPSRANQHQQHLELLELRCDQAKQKRPARGPEAAPLEALAAHQQRGQRTLATKPQANSANKAHQRGPNVCAACAKPIKERYLLMALDKQWHEDCLKCACCDCRLGEVGSSLFTHSDKLLCRRDFLRIFGQPGHCAACKRQIPPYELVMRANELAYHMDCFACQQCQYRFCVGDRYHLVEAHKIICLLCHAERQSAAAQQVGPQVQARTNNSSNVSSQSLADLDQDEEEEEEEAAPAGRREERDTLGEPDPAPGGHEFTQLEAPPPLKQAPQPVEPAASPESRPGEVEVAPGLVTVTVTHDANGLPRTKTMAQLTPPPRRPQPPASQSQQEQPVM